jgi:Ca2+-binding RTX toxin-like protein
LGFFYKQTFKRRYQSTNISNGETTEINIYDCNSLYNWKQLTVQFLDSDELRVSATYDTGSSNYINFTNEYIYSTATTIRGTSLADLFIGDSGHDLFISNGGGDIALGGKGDDTYIISSSSDVIIESFNEGYDSVRSYVSLSLPENVEYGSVLGNALNITGNVLDNYIAGNSLDNSLVGGDGNDIIRGLNGKDTLSGGKGYDTLYGGAGTDQFIFDISLSSGNADVLKDFQSGVDKLVLDDDIFTRFTGKKVVGSGSFIIGNKPLDSNDYLIYDLTTDTLYYDADGAGAQFGLLAIAKIELLGQSAPTFTDFVVVA